MNDVNAFLLETAYAVANKLQTLEKVRCAAVFGSVAVGESDRFSDLEIACFCTEIDNRLQSVIRERLSEEFNVTSTRKYTEPIARVGIYFENRGYRMSVKLCETKQYKEFMLSNYHHFQDEDWLRNLSKCRILFDRDGNVTKLKHLVSYYPKDQAKKIVDQSLRTLNYVVELLEKATGREDSVAFFMALQGGILHAIKVLYAVNGEYLNRSFKRVTREITKFKLKPSNLEEKIRFLIEASNELDNMSQKTETMRELHNDLLKQEFSTALCHQLRQGHTNLT